MTHMMSKVMWLYLKRAIYIFMLYVYVDCILGIFQLVLAATLLTGFINRVLLGYMIHITDGLVLQVTEEIGTRAPGSC